MKYILYYPTAFIPSYPIATYYSENKTITQLILLWISLQSNLTDLDLDNAY